ncbi:MAG: pyridoxal 5'-phosphate synthase glutaminase subunit PdxT [Cellulomonadaceae bacterium]|jgi:5'-phosphate synthase pdxT subunit|nr:pyridoxal 5'-phosphate synthase glutaminase subunit PdxT [Cellulomonadaceae bacterium]
MTAPVIGVLALQGSFADHHAALESCGATAVTVRRISELESVDGLVIPGGESTTIARLLRVFELAAPLRERIASGLPVYGTCAGMILLADRVTDNTAPRTVGGMDVLVRRNAFGRQTESFEADLQVAGIADDAHGGPLRAVFIRAPLIEQCGPAVNVLARVRLADGSNPVVAAQQGHLLATSFHPEITGELRLHQHFVGMCSSGR